MAHIEFISAGAGSGKTYKLTVTLSDALKSGEARPHAILATTFTVKAAAELRERTRSWLLNEGDLSLATAIGLAKIGTVNSVCGQMLKRFCFELGLSPDQVVLSEEEAKRLLGSALAETLDSGQKAELVNLTARFGIEQAEWSKAIQQTVNAARDNGIASEELRAMGAKNADLMLAHWPKPSVHNNLTSVLTAALSKAASEIGIFIQEIEAAGKDVPKNLQKGYLELERLKHSFRQDRWTWPDWIAACNIDAGAKVKNFVLPVAEAAQIHESHPDFHAEVKRYLGLVFGLAAEALDTYAEAKRLLGVVDFSDQEVLLLKAVQENEEVRETLACELDLIMVDEFQDTSPLQLALFVELARLAKRSVWVGDPKQAIYGFRGTDAGLIAGVLSAIPQWGGSIGDPLDTSRRSVPGLVSLTNTVFESAFEPGLSPEEVRLKPFRTDTPDQPTLINWNFESNNNDCDYLGLGRAVKELIDSGMLVEDKVSQKRRPLQAGDIAILCRKHAQVELAVSSLTRWSIPSSSPRKGLLATAEVILVLACIRRLHDSSDTVASALILTLVEGQSVQDWLPERLEFLESEEASYNQWRISGSNAHPLLKRLESLRSSVGALTPKELLRLAVAESHAALIASQWSSSPHESRVRVANIEALQNLASSYESECLAVKRPATTSGLLLWLDALETSGEDNRATSSLDAVSIMTNHAAKGLEWPVVILTSLGESARSSLWGVRARTDGEFSPEHPLQNRFVHFWLSTWGRRKKPQAAINAEASEIGLKMASDALAENTRLLYVSMTRARDINVLVSSRRPSNFIRGWVDELGASGLLFGESELLALPDGQIINRLSKNWSAADCALEPAKQNPTPCKWFTPGKVLDGQPFGSGPVQRQAANLQLASLYQSGNE
ncbi:MAG: UvrD-helicase domain-containing protein [Pseudoalteromonas distincta]